MTQTAPELMVCYAGHMITPENEFQYFHAYRRLAQAGVVDSLKCQCGSDYITLTEDYRLVLWCPVDDYTITPGERMLYNVEQAVRIHNKEN